MIIVRRQQGDFVRILWMAGRTPLDLGWPDNGLPNRSGLAGL
jgi:hypothetical protein